LSQSVTQAMTDEGSRPVHAERANTAASGSGPRAASAPEPCPACATRAPGGRFLRGGAHTHPTGRALLDPRTRAGKAAAEVRALLVPRGARPTAAQRALIEAAGVAEQCVNAARAAYDAAGTPRARRAALRRLDVASRRRLRILDRVALTAPRVADGGLTHVGAPHLEFVAQ
jgi:hypothetical protein